MPEPLQLFIKSSFLNRKRDLIVDQDFIEFDDHDMITEKPTRIDVKDIAAFRYGVKWISGYQFVIGRIYCVDIRSSSDNIIKIRLKSLYGINKKILTDKYAQIVNTIYDFYFDNISRSYLEKFEDGQSFQILGIEFTQNGILLQKNQPIIHWEDVGTKSYTTYYSLFQQSNPSNYKAFEFLQDWNTGILYSVSRQILINKGLHTE